MECLRTCRTPGSAWVPFLSSLTSTVSGQLLEAESQMQDTHTTPAVGCQTCGRLLRCPAHMVLSRLVQDVHLTSSGLRCDPVSLGLLPSSRPESSTQTCIPRAQAALDRGAQWTEPLARTAAVIWRHTPALEEGESCMETVETLASQVSIPKRDRAQSWRDRDSTM